MTLVFCALVALVLAVLLLVVLGLRISKVWLVLVGIAPVVLIYVFNPEFRVYSFHSFMHAGITYQILNGIIPPYDPLLAGQAVAYPWGCHLVAAGISRVFNVTPFMAIAAINVASLLAAMVLIYKISKQLVDDERANILSVVISIYGITLTNPYLMRVLSVGMPTEFRGVPILLKFITINILPIGLVLFLLFIYSVLRLEKTGKMLPNAPLLAAAVLGAGFAYPAFLPGVGASLAALWIVSLACLRCESLRWSLKTIALTVVSLVVSVILIRPYLAALSAGTMSQLSVFSGKTMAANAIKSLVVAVPVLLVIFANARAFKRTDRKALVFLAVTIAATAFAYVSIHLNMDNEYKFLLLSTVVLGIPGGVAFARLIERCPGWRAALVFVLLGLFIFPSLRFVARKLVQERSGRSSQAFVERGRSLHSTDPEADQFYQWIKTNTDPRSAFIDTELEIPVLAERALLVGTGGREPGQRKGFGPVDMILRQQSGYPHDVLDRRTAILDKTFAKGQPFSKAELSELAGLPGPVYAVRRGGLAAGVDTVAFQEVFVSREGNLRLYRFRDQ